MAPAGPVHSYEYLAVPPDTKETSTAILPSFIPKQVAASVVILAVSIIKSVGMVTASEIGAHTRVPFSARVTV